MSGAPAYVFQGRPVTMPVVVRDASSAAATYLVSTAAARRLLPGPELEPVELLPGRALFSIAAIDYRDNDLGDYNEVSLAFFVRARGAPRGIPYLGTLVDFLRNRVATYIWKLPVNQSFTRDAGYGIWGFPKTVDVIDFRDAGGRRECRLVMDGRHVLTFTAHATGSRTLPDAEMVTYSYVGGTLHRTTFTAGASEVGFALGGAELVLGDHPIADDLRTLGLPKAALMTVWMGRQHGRFDAPVPVQPTPA
ncbi:MAG TPA: acetoacetate decarboxylase family protein [Candidatus Limnocylindria bacterium]|nr:acetoacetate decarboxylase family protein [Candidatus Limnocylindria bacterium]